MKIFMKFAKKEHEANDFLDAFSDLTLMMTIMRILWDAEDNLKCQREQFVVTFAIFILDNTYLYRVNLKFVNKDYLDRNKKNVQLIFLFGGCIKSRKYAFLVILKKVEEKQS